MDHLHAVSDDLRRATRDPRRVASQAWAAFVDMQQAAVAEGSVPSHVKELVALAIGVIQHCDESVECHARAAAQKGATREEAAEVLAVALLMGGAPSSVWATRALQAFDELKTAEVSAA